ncbi:MAG: hypothetical protein DI565_12265 [Ancylobacter novellus]|uniref:Uncharacterized protein n=1 Tax=Ancylobacter novellus TaxID=921 RepID=A0A2W5KAY2_ANCNO|nr:MAG: hypothetical protein DI565_12265 [Ancylobacter novellus]
MFGSLNPSKRFDTFWYHRKPRFWFQKDRPRPEGHRETPEVVRFEVEPGVTPSDKPPVRIFLGTEPFQARAERVFFWSVKQHRDPSRVYEIYLMKDLKGYDRRGWKTGFTFLRFAIPGLAGYQGRAIYNDVDQIYLSDPAELFDADMGGKGMLAITATDDSVMLIDCEVMAKHWPLQDVQREGAIKKRFRNAVKDNDLWGRLPGVWNARDDEFDAAKSKCFHFTTLQTQPWRPFPDQLIYRSHPDGEVWFALERAADAARYNGFSREKPGSRFAAYLQRVGNGLPAWGGPKDNAEIMRLISSSGAKTVLDYGAPAPDGAARPFAGCEVARLEPGRAPFAEPVAGTFDGVVAVDALSRVPEEDIPWALDELFAAAKRFVYVSVASEPSRMGDGAAPLPATWWKLQMELAANRTPGRSWALAANEPNATEVFRSGK